MFNTIVYTNALDLILITRATFLYPLTTIVEQFSFSSILNDKYKKKSIIRPSGSHDYIDIYINNYYGMNKLLNKISRQDNI